MTLVRISAAEAIADLARFDTIVDARSEGEYAEDRLPGAVNWPSLDDAERAAIGTEYKQVSAFEAKKRGAALVARNVAAHIERHVIDKPREWTPLVYCWRGGKRSGALATVLEQIGFRVHVLEGGYREFRRAVVAELDDAAGAIRLARRLRPDRVRQEPAARRAGAPGRAGARPRGARQPSRLGARPRPGQHASPRRRRSTPRVWDALARLRSGAAGVRREREQEGRRPARPRGADRAHARGALPVARAAAGRTRRAADRGLRLLRADTDAFCARLDALARRCAATRWSTRWQEAARAGRTGEVVRDLLVAHYDPIYLQSMRRNFAGVAAPALRLEWDGSETSLSRSAAAAIAVR